jgi:casein kinase II subunit beta
LPAPAHDSKLAPHAEAHLAPRTHHPEPERPDPGAAYDDNEPRRERSLSLSAAFEKACSVEDVTLDDFSSAMSSSSQAPESWISAFCSLVGHEYFAEVSEEFIEDDFNLTGLQSQVPMYKEALEMILDVEPEDATDDEEEEEEDEDEDDDDMQQDGPDGISRGYRRAQEIAERRHMRMASDLSVIESSAEMLYGLIHQRFITSRPGIQQMAEKYELGHFGHCPRVYCHGAKVLPVGCSDIPGQETVKLFCPSCLDVYTPPNSRFQTVDGAFFGTTFGCLFFMTFPELDVGGQRPPSLPEPSVSSPLATNKDSRSSLSSSLTSQQPPIPPPPISQLAQQNQNQLPPQPESINGVAPKNLAPGLGAGNIYEPRIYGFRVSEIAKTGPRMKWLRSRPQDVNELDECRIWAENQQPQQHQGLLQAGEGADADAVDTLADSEMAEGHLPEEEEDEEEGEVEDEDMDVNGEPPVGVVASGHTASSASQTQHQRAAMQQGQQGQEVPQGRKQSRRRTPHGLTNGENGGAGGGGTALSVGGAG